MSKEEDESCWFRVEGWRSHDLVRPTSGRASIDLAFTVPPSERGALHAVSYVIKRMVDYTACPVMLFLDLSLLHERIPRPDWRGLADADVRIVVPDHPVHSVIREGKPTKDILRVREELRESEGRLDRDEDDLQEFYTEREIETLKDMSIL